MHIVTRLVLLFLLCATALFPFAALLQDINRVVASSDAELVAHFAGNAFEDVFGFGFWPTWICLFVAEVSALLAAKYFLRSRWLVSIAALVLVAFSIVSVVSYQAFSREHALWLTHTYS